MPRSLPRYWYKIGKSEPEHPRSITCEVYDRQAHEVMATVYDVSAAILIVDLLNADDAK